MGTPGLPIIKVRERVTGVNRPVELANLEAGNSIRGKRNRG